MANKSYCETHHFKYSGARCPFCEKDRIGAMSHRLEKQLKREESEQEEIQKDLDWNDLAGIFNVTTSKK